ncbi:MBL fold metallo-hydrolase [Carnobacteriaceae bacterium zg-ZUI252]|nr:MBL fold metallo-hydrolase [Carnobacteriaceae bacterium zg-ZUI252]QTU83534.1 MBL fold metallo-hydrolase [Carnobacteriaceae bacterium zg-C25]
MKLTILGCMGAYPSNNMATSSYLIESDGFKLLLDMGSSSFQNLAKIMEPTDIDALILSHYHHDHIADVGVLSYAFQLKPVLEEKKQKQLTIYAHQQNERFSDLTIPNVSTGIAYNPEEILRVGPFKITFLKTIHPVICYAMRIEDKVSKKVLVYTADSAYLADFITFAKNADMLLADGMLLDGNENHPAHMTSAQVAKIAELADVKEVVLTHLPPFNQETLLQQAKAVNETISFHLAKDLDEYTI